MAGTTIDSRGYGPLTPPQDILKLQGFEIKTDIQSLD